MNEQRFCAELTHKVISELEDVLARLYETFTSGLPFHGWHHVQFVRSRAVSYAEKNGSNVLIVEAAALVHDLNYMVKRNSRIGAGEGLRREILEDLQVSNSDIVWIEQIIRESEIEVRDETASREAQALSDADTLFKALPVTPVILANLYMKETGKTLAELCDHILDNQIPLLECGIYFYDPDTRMQYKEWTEANLRLWQAIRESLHDPIVQAVVADVEQNFIH
jgi:uncharacterized protein